MESREKEWLEEQEARLEVLGRELVVVKDSRKQVEEVSSIGRVLYPCKKENRPALEFITALIDRRAQAIMIGDDDEISPRRGQGPEYLAYASVGVV